MCFLSRRGLSTQPKGARLSPSIVRCALPRRAYSGGRNPRPPRRTRASRERPHAFSSLMPQHEFPALPTPHVTPPQHTQRSYLVHTRHSSVHPSPHTRREGTILCAEPNGLGPSLSLSLISSLTRHNKGRRCQPSVVVACPHLWLPVPGVLIEAATRWSARHAATAECTRTAGRRDSAATWRAVRRIRGRRGPAAAPTSRARSTRSLRSTRLSLTHA